MKGKIAGIGEILWDMLPDGKQLGGAPANFAYHVSRLGGEGVAISAVGDDAPGKEIRDVLVSKNLDSVLAVADAPTGYVKVTMGAGGVPSYEITENVAWDNIPFTDGMRCVAEQARAVCFGTLAQRSEASRRTIRQFIAAMPEDSLKVFDINLRQNYYDKELICSSLELSDILKINDDELEIVSGMLSLSGTQTERCRAIAAAFNQRLVILTRGSMGSDVITGDTVHTIVPEKIEVVDTVGAGDSFTAAFVTSYLDGCSIESAHALAGKVSSYVCTRAGAMPE